MTAPALAAERFLRCLAVGLALGLGYGALRPLRRRATALADGIFGVLLVWGWVCCSFGICGGDLRLGMTLAMLLGIWVWEVTAGRLLRPVFDIFWKFVAGVFRPIQIFLHFLRKFAKKLFATVKKWVTINCKNSRKHQHKGGARHASYPQISQTDPSGIPSQQHPDQSGGAVRCRTVYGGADRGEALR